MNSILDLHDNVIAVLRQGQIKLAQYALLDMAATLHTVKASASLVGAYSSLAALLDDPQNTAPVLVRLTELRHVWALREILEVEA